MIERALDPACLAVPASAGGPMDGIGRIIAERLRTSIGQTVNIEKEHPKKSVCKTRT
jgi:tripartite-type tricarboxylate transporter receptor subunit TctC